MGFAKFMEDNEQLYIERQIDHGKSFAESSSMQRATRREKPKLKPLLCETRTSEFAVLV